VKQRTACAVGGLWGLAEATLFFIVPDVWLTFLALKNLRRSLAAAAWALGGALLGGVAMYALGAHAHGAALRALDAVPAISPALIARVHRQIDAHGLWATFFGPIGGVPYKIYAVDWGGRHSSLLAFLLVSLPARGLRFFLAPLLTVGIRRLVLPLSQGREAIETTLLAAFWVGLYAFYFTHYGW
jgi:membrane protein YqaA with SNARE-associated domain